MADGERQRGPAKKVRRTAARRRAFEAADSSRSPQARRAAKIDVFKLALYDPEEGTDARGHYKRKVLRSRLVRGLGNGNS